jgi:ADP-heptose:LPS heptosyltransferase
MPTESPSGCRPPRILLTRLTSLGDVIHGLPVLNALRHHFPACRLAWVVEEHAGSLLLGHKALDELFFVPYRWRPDVSSVWAIGRRLRSFAPDISIDLQGRTQSAFLAWISGAKRRIGFGDRGRPGWSRLLNNVLVSISAAHIVDGNLELLKPLGIQSPEVCFNLPERSMERESIGRAIVEAGLEDGFAVINVGAGCPSRIWSASRYAAVAEFLGRVWGLPSVVVWAGQRELSRAKEAVDGAGGWGRLAGESTLFELAALLRRARLMIASDTGPLHLAAAVGTPCVGLFGPTSAQRTGPYGVEHVPVQSPLPAAPADCHPLAAPRLMNAIGVEAVCAACDRVLLRQGQFVSSFSVGAAV